MESRAHAIAAGLFALLLGFGVVFSLWWFSDRREDTRDVLLVTSGSVNGLNPQANVRYRGIAAGKVAGITLDPANPRDLLVRIRIRADLPVTEGTRARLSTQGVTGLAFIALDDRGDKPAPLMGVGGDPPRIPLAPGLVEEVADASVQTLRQVKLVTERLAGLGSPENLARIERSLVNLEAASAGLDRTLKEAPATLAAVRQVLSPDNVARIGRSLDNLERFSNEAVPTVVEARQLLVRLQTTTERVEALVGSAGARMAGSTLPQVDGLLRELTQTSRQLSSLLGQLDETPQVLLGGRRPAPAGPGEKGFQLPVGEP
ncbi:MlaD family protein [Zoogloea sp.]|uniref:MlaD family protein n=1 Tax=Zoogloea sp. TaxID=49181 RepID=UPI002613FA67|nr:MlaD family protein [Zoogloea sp.]MDD3353664.1 MlaD family protein [Zoogloea sp.]